MTTYMIKSTRSSRDGDRTIHEVEIERGCGATSSIEVVARKLAELEAVQEKEHQGSEEARMTDYENLMESFLLTNRKNALLRANGFVTDEDEEFYSYMPQTYAEFQDSLMETSGSCIYTVIAIEEMTTAS